jgi:arylesterase / paraoxonase
VGGGSIGYCSKEGCKIAKDTGLTHPNGIVRGHDGFIYTPSSINGEIKVLSLDEHQDLTEIGSFKMPMPVDNLSVDKHGHMLAAGFPQIYKLLRHSKGPFGYQAPSAIYVLQRQERTGLAATAGNEWHEGSIMVTKIMEDDGAVLSGFSIAVHDAETGQVFLGGPLTPFITICETR